MSADRPTVTGVDQTQNGSGGVLLGTFALR